MIWLIFDAEGVHKNLLCACEFCTYHYIEMYSLLVCVHEFLPHFPHSLSHLGEIWCKRSAHNAVKHLRVQWKLVQVRLYFSYWH